MNNNDVLRRVRYTFDFDDSTMIKIFSLADFTVTREQVSAWLKKEDDAELVEIEDVELATFLNGFINFKRGKKEGVKPEPEKRLTNNILFRKLKIALDLQAEDILAIMYDEDFNISKHELSAFFRKPGHKHFRTCNDQIMRKFLSGLQHRYHEDSSES